MIKFFIKALGCKVSQYDAERLAETLRNKGLVLSEEKPDLFILHGCSVTGRASQKVRQTLRAARKRWGHVKIVLSGCEARLVTQRNQQVPEADWLLTDNEFESVEKMLSALSLDVLPQAVDQVAAVPVSSRTRAFLKIQDGCSQFCSYCIVAHLRGQEWSRPIAEAVEEARMLVEEGHKEIVLTGIHLGHYRPSLVELLRELEKIDGLKRIRLSSIESIEVTDELIDWIAGSEKACRHFHLPLQSGCNEILKAMRRPYTTDEFKKVVEKIRAKMPLAAITTDLIVGFPGETEEFFQGTLTFLCEIEFSRIHIFKFSPRDGTPAATMPGQVDNACKAERSDRVERIWRSSALSFFEKFVGRQLEVLWETFENGLITGTSREYIPCHKPCNFPEMSGKIELVNGISSGDNGLLVE